MYKDMRVSCLLSCSPIARFICSRISADVISMMTSSKGNIFRVTGPLCGEFIRPRWIPCTKASDAELWCFFALRLNKPLSKQSWGWWCATQLRSLWRHCNSLCRSYSIDHSNLWLCCQMYLMTNTKITVTYAVQANVIFIFHFFFASVFLCLFFY